MKAEDGLPAIDAGVFREVLSGFCSGVTVVTAMGGDRPVGLTCQSFMSMSLDPPLVAFAPAVTSTTYAAIQEAGHFGVSVLAADQAALASTFARRGGDRFAGVRWHRAVTGAPLLDGAIAHIECDIVREFRVGDHLLVVGRVVALAGVADAAPLLFFHSSFRALSGEPVPPPGAVSAGTDVERAGW